MTVTRNHEELEDRALQNISAAPATKEGHEELARVYGQKDPQKVSEGDVVYLYSRGSYRRAIVTKVTPTKIKAFYTTEGAVTEAQRIYDAYAALDPQKQADAYAEQAAKNYSYYLRVVTEYRERVAGGETLASFEQADFANYLVMITDETREEHVARKAAEAYEAAQAKKDANKTYRQYVHFTTKDAKKDDIYLV